MLAFLLVIAAAAPPDADAFVAVGPADDRPAGKLVRLTRGFTATPADTPPAPARYDWLAGVRNRDVLRFRNGDTAKGTLDGLDPEAAGAAFAFRPEQGAARTVAGSEVAAVAFNPDLARARKPK